MIAVLKKMIRGSAPVLTKVQRYPALFFLMALHLCCFSQKPYIQFDPIGINAGLSESNILCILQDSRGFMWFGTSDGLHRYDGYSFTRYKFDKNNPASISNNFIQAIAESKNGDLWVATMGGGLCRYERRKDRFIHYRNDLQNSNSIAADDVNTVVEDSNGNVWIGTSEGLDRFDPEKKLFTHYRHNSNDENSISDNYIRKIFEDSHHELWIATQKGGLNLFNPKKGLFTRFRHSRNNERAISSDNVFTIFEDSRKRLWIGTNENGLSLFDKVRGQFTNFQHSDNNRNSLVNNSVRAIIESSDNKLWIGTENGGISVFDPAKNLFTSYTNDELDKYSPGSNSINTLYKDNKGNIWIGTFNAGINLVDIDAGKFRHYQHIPFVNSLSHNKVLCFYETAGKKIWIGTDGGGLNLFDPQTGHFTNFRHQKQNKNSISGDNILSVCEDSNGNVWIGTWGNGITVFNPVSQTYRHFKNDPYDSTSLSSNNAWTIYEDKSKNIWIGTYGGGLNKFDPANNSFTSYQYDENNESTIGDNWINSIREDSEGNLWICTSGGGLNLFNNKNNSFTRFQPQEGINSISNSNVNSLYEDGHKKLWIGTQAGLNVFDKKNKQFAVFTSADGLPGNVIFGILEDLQGHLWISTDKGISRFNPATKSFKNFGIADGLQSDKFRENAYLKSSSGAMYFGGNNGFNLFYPADIKTIAFEPPVVITSFQIFNKEVGVAKNPEDPSPLKENISEIKSIELSYKYSLFSFAFASLNYSAHEKRQYAYMMEGFDKTWNEIGTQHTATYTNLDPGNYIFKVRGLNNDGKWSDTIRTIELTINPPFWLTWWFRIGVFVLIAGIIVAFYLARINEVKRRERILKQKVKEQTAQLELLNEEERKARQEAVHANEQLEKKNKELEQFVYIASHDLREPLRTTTSFVELLQKQYKGQLDQKADTFLSYISQASERMKTLINDLLDYSRIGSNKELQQVDCNIILEEVLSDLGIALKEAGAEITAGILPVLPAHRTAIKQLFQNLISNGIKFRKKDTAPRIRISAEQVNGYWKFSFADNGIGIDKQHKDKIFVIFQRLHSRKEYEGSGIGLAHCKKIVELHKGNIWVESTPGEGSTFHFTIHKNNNYES